MLEDPRLKAICRIGQGAACCRYVVLTPDRGFQCAKLNPTLARQIAWRQQQQTMGARGDNCAGLPMDPPMDP